MKNRLKLLASILMAVLLAVTCTGCLGARAGREAEDLLQNIADALAPEPEVPQQEFAGQSSIFDAMQVPEGGDPAQNPTEDDAFTLYTNVSNKVVFYKDIPYKAAPEDAPQANLFDICGPADAGNTNGVSYPFILFVGGGSWQSIDKEGMRTHMITMAHYGFVTASINTRTLPAYGLNAQVEDVLDAFKYFHDAAANMGIDPNNMFIMGGSSGGNIGLLAAYTMGEGFAPESKTHGYVFNIRGVCSYAAPVLIEEMGNSILAESENATDANELAQALLGVSPVDNPAAFRRADPREYVSAASPPTLVIQGELDETVPKENGQALYDALVVAQVPTELKMYADVTHTDWPLKTLLQDSMAFFHSQMAEQQ